MLKRIRTILKYGWGEPARIRKQAEKIRRREEQFHSSLWQKDNEIARRHYSHYEEYIKHQSSKLEKIYERLLEKENEDFEEFCRRFQLCQKEFDQAGVRSVLCLGARLGTEVKALHTLGYFAIGIDLNPGSENPYVLFGDFHNIVFPERSVDAIYTNAFDHVYDPERVVHEIRRLLRPGGLFVLDQLEGFQEGFIPGEFESFHWRDRNTLNQKIEAWGGFQKMAERDLGQHRRDHWYQVVFRKLP